ncbi:unnamed protein product [Musa acuminata subsp. malaccensis]|uniref:DNA-directed RNA polymerase n=1 Tax=Musa acuminata subsp. malaccensis TaxID=214687 RepID=A0A804HNN4_MUSAM|nr:unnamed protein product [Musa acuminata subsp. malaccensis]
MVYKRSFINLSSVRPTLWHGTSFISLINLNFCTAQICHDCINLDLPSCAHYGFFYFDPSVLPLQIFLNVLMYSQPRFVVPYCTGVLTRTWYGTVPVYRGGTSGCTERYTLVYRAVHPAVPDGPCTDNLSDRYVPPDTGGTLRYGRHCSQLSSQMNFNIILSELDQHFPFFNFKLFFLSFKLLHCQVGAISVNLIAGEKPADVYSEIAARVLGIMRRDADKDPTVNRDALRARLLVDQVDRKLIKQTVMTSVYGVTYVGAREQINRRLKERGLIADDTELFGASCYAAKTTLTALGEMFQAARSIMNWLGDCAKVRFVQFDVYSIRYRLHKRSSETDKENLKGIMQCSNDGMPSSCTSWVESFNFGYIFD